MTRVRIAVAQPSGEPGTPQAAEKLLGEVAADAASKGADVVVLPELFSVGGYTLGKEAMHALADAAEEPEVGWIARVRTAAARAGVAVVASGAVRGAGGAVLNVAIFVDSTGALLHTYAKTHLYGRYEADIFSAGSTLETFEWRGIRVGMLICMDAEYTEPARILALQGARIIFIPTALAQRDPVNHLVACAVLPTRAMENHVHIAWCNYAGSGGSESHPPITYNGESAILAPHGADLARAGRAAAADARYELLVADADLDAYDDEVRRNPYLQERRPELYSALASAPSA